MRKMLIGVFTLVSVAAVASACGSNDKSSNKRSNKVDGKAPAVQMAAGLAQKASVADARAVAGDGTAGTVGTPGDPEKASKPPRFTLVLGEGKGGFRFRSVTLSDDAKAMIDELFTGGKVDLKDARYEIEGYTDNLGSKAVNEQTGLARAEAVKQYLSERYEVPMDSISVTSFGSEKPVGDNATPEGRAQNRRVVIKVLD